MKNLDAAASYEGGDPAQIGEALRRVPEWCRAAYEAGREFDLPHALRHTRRIVFAGVGHAAAAGELMRALYVRESPLHWNVWRDYDLPAFAAGPDTLVIIASSSGNEDEPLSALEQARQRQCSTLVICPPGTPADRTTTADTPRLWLDQNCPTHLVSLWHMFVMLGVLGKLWLIPDPHEHVDEAIGLLVEVARGLGPDTPTARNPSKRLAGQFVERLPIIIGAGPLAPVACYWKLQLHHLAKTAAACDEMPNVNHGAILGYTRPDSVWQKSIVVALRGPCDDARIAARHDLTTTFMLQAGLNQDTVRAKGKTTLAQVCSLAYFGDWTAYYTAIMSGVNPAPAPTLDEIEH
ncbi:MAG: SIS domain-containing protein [Anaerolineae bacterium]|nr:SIS domain-containing protein [Thermoflexales bacterium]MDW8407389.1 SIS domain-containing protein [Anaerolineae bacterium]